jgi:hypothetical protein
MEVLKQKISEVRRLLVAPVSFQEAAPLLILLFIAVAVSFALHGTFFLLSPYIWSLNPNVPLNEITPWIRAWLTEKDGMETYALYALVLVNLVLVALLARLAERLKAGKYLGVFGPVFGLVFLGLLVWFRLRVGFHPPMGARGPLAVALCVTALVGIVSCLVTKLAGRHRRLADLLIIFGLLPICFVATRSFSPNDYAYVFAPALGIIDHFKLSEIYFQYDLLISLFAAAWLKLRLDLNAFQVLAQASFYALFLGSFFASRRFFRAKNLSYWLLFALVLMKVYALMHDPIMFFQVTPLRLDLWIILFVLAYGRGIYSRWLGAALGLMLVFHRAFGLIYVLGYFELLATLWFLDCVSRPFSWSWVKESAGKLGRRAGPNVLMILVLFGLSCLAFGAAGLEAASLYQKLGIGFLQIHQDSFYWYVPILFSVTFALLLKNRRSLNEKYFHGGMFLIFLAIGESLYFFGRSHENNIINISAVLLFVTFLLMDLILSWANERERSAAWKFLASALPVLLVLAVAFFYSGIIKDKLVSQFQNVAKGQLIYPMPVSLGPNTLKPIVGDSQKVYFLGDYDFYYYYAWGYVPQGRFQPYDAWIYKKDLTSFLQGLIDGGYFVVVPKAEVKNQQEILSSLKYGHEVQPDGFLVIWK